LESGLYQLRLNVAAPDDPQVAVTLPIGDFQVTGWSRVFDPPEPAVEVGANFGDQATLVGVDAGASQLSAGETLTARLHWRAESEFDQNYTAFVHLIGPDGLLYGQVDQVPGAGAYPTTGWLPGEYLTDEYAIPIAENAPAGPYQIEVGLYDPDTGRRLPVTPPDCQTETCQKSDDKVLLPGLTVQ
jgi:hypothetical protein